jgi:hypothetical protein
MERLNQFMESFSSLDILKLELKEELAVGKGELTSGGRKQRLLD